MLRMESDHGGDAQVSGAQAAAGAYFAQGYNLRKDELGVIIVGNCSTLRSSVTRSCNQRGNDMQPESFTPGRRDQA